jgi:hypothetical protein
VTELFRLNDDEQRLLSVLLHSAAPRTAAELATELDLPLPRLLSLLAPEGALRGRALVEAPDAASLGWALPSDPLVAGRGLAVAAHSPRQPGSSDDRLLFLATLPGLSYLPAPAPEVAWAQQLASLTGADRPSEKPPQAIVDLVREQLTSPQPVLLSVGGVGSDQLTALSSLLQKKQQRPVVMLDGSALAGWPVTLQAAVLRRLRRDTDLRGAILILHEVRSLGGSWRSALLPRPAGQTAPLIVASEGPALPLGVLPAALRGEVEWTVASVTLRPQPLPSQASLAPALTPSPSGEPVDENEDPAVAASRQEARRQAAIDAARAMGRPVPKELLTPTPVAKPTPAAASTATASPAIARPAAPPEPAPAPAATAATSKPNPVASKPAPAPSPSPPSDGAPRRPLNPRLAAALASAGLPPPGSDEYANSEYAQRRAAARAAAAATREASAPSPAAATDPQPAAPTPPEPPASAPVGTVAVTSAATSAAPSVPAAAAPAAEPSSDDEGAPLPLEAEAPLEELVRVARATPSSLQRAEILRKLTGARHSAVIALFRAFVSSQHPAVREAAEGGMSSLFGPNWNRTRSIAPPAQPPRTDDGGRGPGGAF